MTDFFYIVIYCDYFGKIYIWDSRIETGRPPYFGVMAIVQTDSAVLFEIVTNGDFYCLYPSGRWFAVDPDGKKDYEIHVEKTHILQGRMVERSDYYRAMGIAQEHLHELKNKTGWLPGERRYEKAV